MFHRRLVLLLSAFAVAMAVMSAQLARLTIVQGQDHLAAAESRLVRRSWIPTLRGRILDRDDRPLARARPSYEVAVDYPVLSGRWATRRAERYAAALHRGVWDRLTPAQRHALIERYEPAYRDHVDAMWDRLATAGDVPRVQIDDRRERTIARIERMQASIAESRRRAALQEARDEGRRLTPAFRHAVEARASQPIREKRSPHILLTRVPDATAFELERLATREATLNPAGLDRRDAEDTVPIFPGLKLKDATARHYPFESMRVAVNRATLPRPLRDRAPSTLEVEGVATHLVGWMRDTVYAEDHERRAALLEGDPARAARAITETGADRGGYLEKDRVGSAGLEAVAEHVLRGLRGQTVHQLDTGTQHEIPPEPGRDVRTTLDIALQARLHAALDPDLGLARVQSWHGGVDESMPEGTPLHGAAVVLEIDTGDILAMASTPSFTREAIADDPESVFDDPVRTPWVNRALDKPYPPGSVAKALVLVEAHRRDKVGISERIPCTGYLYEDEPEHFRCWIFKQNPGYTHSMMLGHDPGPVEALMGSCNIYFYTLGRRLGPDGITEVYRDFGVGEGYELGAGLGRPVGGPEAGAARITSFPGGLGRAWNPEQVDHADATLMGIGQGPVAWTPLHAADAYATIARGGVRLQPRLIRDGSPPVASRVLDLRPAGVDAALRGLFEVVNNRQGTAEHLTYADGTREPIFNTPDHVAIWGKTGTAQAPELRIDPDEDGPDPPRVVRRGDHAWFVLLAGRGRPEYAIAVILEYAGSGAKATGPVANQIVHALVEEGYLDKPS